MKMKNVNGIFDEKNKKDKFIVDSLIPYLVGRIKKDKSIKRQVASMCIFPYRTNNGVMLGSMNESDVFWYYSNNKDLVSTDTYRILAEEVLKKETAADFKQVFEKYIEKFSGIAVVNSILKRMGKETKYSEIWWKYAFSVFEIRKKDNINIVLSGATKDMNNDSFLFLDKYKDIKDGLIKYCVFSDINTEAVEKVFWKNIKEEEREKAESMLKEMGVPCSFCNGEINKNIRKFFKRKFQNLAYPIEKNSSLSEMCQLSYDIIWKYIWEENNNLFQNIINNDQYNFGIMATNVFGDFVPLSWDLFYEDPNDTPENMANKGVIKTESGFEYQHIDIEKYKKCKDIEKIHKFSDIGKSETKYKFYKFLGNMKYIEFYKWVWSYSQHKELISSILQYLNDTYGEKYVIHEQYAEFVLDVCNKEEIVDKEYKFKIDMQYAFAFKHSDKINRISYSFKKVYPILYGGFSKHNPNEYKYSIINSVAGSGETKDNISKNDIWNHIYLVKNGEINRYNDIYIRCKLHFNNETEDALVLWPSDDKNSYINAISQYIRDQYDVIVEKPFDWKEEYNKLAKKMHEFIEEKYEKKLYQAPDMDMEDVDNFGSEQRIWNELRRQRKEIFKQSPPKNLIDLESWKIFLDAKYRGKCQLCGKQTITGECNAHFYTYRIIKESENRLANMYSNLFCLCPTCHGRLGYGKYMGQDMHKILEKAKKYYDYINSALDEGNIEDHNDCLIKELAKDNDELEGFKNPIICDVTVNGKECKMAFSWEHFIRITFILCEPYEE